MLLLLLAMATLFGGGADDACDIEEIVLALSVAIDGDLIEDTVGDVIDCVATDGDFKGRMGCIGNCTGCCCGCICGGCVCICCRCCTCCCCCWALSLTGLYLLLFLNSCGHVLLSGPRPSFLSLLDGPLGCGYGCIVHRTSTPDSLRCMCYPVVFKRQS